EDAFFATEQVALDLKGTVAIADVDAGSGTLTVTLTVAYGHMNVAAGSTGVMLSGPGGPSITVTGTLTQIQAFFSAGSNSMFEYRASTDNPPGSTTLTVTVNDGGNTGTGGALIASDSETIYITAVNDAPLNSVPGATQNV